MKGLFAICLAVVCVLLVAAPTTACDYGVGSTSFSIVQQPVYAQSFAVQSYAQPIVQQQVVRSYAAPVVVRERFVRRPVVVRERVRVHGYGRGGLSVRVGGW